VRAHIDKTLEEARLSGTRTITAASPVPELQSKNGMVRSGAERETVNIHPGTAADIQEGDDRRRRGARERTARARTVPHDPDRPRRAALRGARAGAVAELVRDVMERAKPLSVPTTVDVGIGKNWKEAKP
jgi:DNA polymerase I-like protein with 3'-5' exonuclease and polymerase domains